VLCKNAVEKGTLALIHGLMADEQLMEFNLIGGTALFSASALRKTKSPVYESVCKSSDAKGHFIFLIIRDSLTI